jgi:hypothetical protein
MHRRLIIKKTWLSAFSYAQSRSSLVFCCSLGFLVPWFSSLTAVLADFLCHMYYTVQCKTFKVICVFPPPSCHPPPPPFQSNFGGMKEPVSVQLFLRFRGTVFSSLFKQPAHVQCFCVILEVCNGRFLFPCFSQLNLFSSVVKNLICIFTFHTYSYC